MSGFLDASVADPTKFLLRHTVKSGGQVTGYLSDMLAFVDHTGTPDIIRALPHAPAVVEGNRISYDTGYGVIGYEASLTEFKLTVQLYAPILDANGNPRIPGPGLDPSTAMLTVTGGMTVAEGVSLIDCTGGEGDIATPGEVYLVDSDGARVLTLDRIRAWDSAEPKRNDSHGEIRIVSDGAGGRRVYQGISWAWLRTATLPAFIDPTLIVASATLTGSGSRLTVLTDGTDYAHIGTGTRVSKNAGAAWSAMTSGGGMALGFQEAVVDANDILFAVNTTALGDTLSLIRYAPSADRLTLTLTVLTIAAGVAGTSYFARIVVKGAVGVTKTVHVLYSTYDGTNYSLKMVPVTATTGGTMTLGTVVTLVAAQSQAISHDLSMDASGNVYTAYSLGSSTTIATRLADGTGATSTVVVTGGANNAIRGISGMSSAYWLVNTTLISRTAVIATITTTDITLNLQYIAAVGVTSQSLVAVFGKRVNAPNAGYTGLWTIRLSDGQVTDRGAVQTTQAAHATTPYHTTSRGPFTGPAVPFMFQGTGSNGPYFETASLNQTPYAPLLSVPATAFDATGGTDIQITHQDGDGDTGGSYHLKRVRSTDGAIDYWSVAAGNFVASEIDNDGFGPIYTILAASNAGEWLTTSGISYQLSSQTRDTSGVWGPYSPTPVVVTPGTKPVAGLTSPGATVTTGAVTAQGTSTQAVSAYHYELLNAAGTTVLEDGLWQNGTSIPPWTFAYAIANGVSYKARFTVKNTTGAGIASDPVLQSFTSSFTPPLAPSAFTATPSTAEASIVLGWTQTNNATVASSWCVERSLDGGTTWTKQGVVSVTNYTDYTPASGKPYSYRVQAIGSNGVMTASATVTALVSWSDWVFRPVDGSALIVFSGGPAKAPWAQGQDINEPPTQSALRREYVGAYVARKVDLTSLFGPSNGVTAFTTREILRGYVLSRTEGWLKSPGGDVMRGKLQGMGGEERLPTPWQDVRLGFKEMRKVVP
jgi:hypothetical protein